MITEDWVRIPVRIQDIVPIGLGSATIDTKGHIEVTLPSGEMIGKVLQQAVRDGQIEALMLVPVMSSPKIGDMEESVGGEGS